MYDLSGVNQNVSSAANAVGGIDVNAFTLALTQISDTQSGTQTIYSAGTDFVAGGSQSALNIIAPITSGYCLRVFYDWTTTDGTWRTNDLVLGTLYRVVVTYNRSATTNDPRVWINGVEQVLTELTTPAGSAVTGIDSVRLGENASAGQDWDGKAGELAIWSRILSDDEAVAVSKGYSPARIRNGLQHYWPLVRTLEDRISGANLTATGATVVAHTGVIYPRAWGPMVIQAGAVQEASGALTGTGTLFGSIGEEVDASGALAGLGTLSGVGHRLLAVSGSLSGEGQISAFLFEGPAIRLVARTSNAVYLQGGV